MHVLMPKTIGKLFARNVNIHSLQQKKRKIFTTTTKDSLKKILKLIVILLKLRCMVQLL